jgi:DME family drug/metabolite transporter
MFKFNKLYGLWFALAAAMLNASIGTFSKILILNGLSPSTIAWAKTLLGALILWIFLPFFVQKEKGISQKSKWYHVMICAFFGLLIMFICETTAYGFDTAANVVVTLMASACFSAMIFGYFLLGEKILFKTVLGALLTLLGVVFIFGVNIHAGFNVLGILLGACAGMGYGVFSVLMKKWQLQGGLIMTRQLLTYGCAFLFIPFSLNLPNAFNLTPTVIFCLLALAILPTILGFYCTTKAINYLPPSQVQIIELSEPLFAGVIAFIFLNEQPSWLACVGGLLIMIGIAMANGLLPIKFWRKD